MAKKHRIRKACPPHRVGLCEKSGHGFPRPGVLPAFRFPAPRKDSSRFRIRMLFAIGTTLRDRARRRRHEGRRRKGLRRRLRMFHVKHPFSCAPPFPARDRTASGAGDTSSSRHHPLLHVELMIAQAFHEFEVVEDAEHRGAFGFQLLDEGAHLELRRVVERDVYKRQRGTCGR